MRAIHFLTGLLVLLAGANLYAEADAFSSLNTTNSLRRHILERRRDAANLNETEKKIIETEDELKRNPQDEKKWLDLAALYDEQMRSSHKDVFFQKVDRTPETFYALHKAVECNPNSTEALMRLGVLDLQRNRSEEAKTLFKKVTEIDPNNGDAWGLLANLLSPMVGSNGASDAAAEKALGLDLNYPEASEYLCEYLAKNKRFEDAYETSKRNVAINPDFQKSHYMMVFYAGIIQDQQKREKALDECMQVAQATDSKYMYSLIEKTCRQIGEDERAESALWKAKGSKNP